MLCECKIFPQKRQLPPKTFYSCYGTTENLICVCVFYSAINGTDWFCLYRPPEIIFVIYLIDREISILVLDAFDSFLIFHKRLEYSILVKFFYVGEN
jgi:hypothetical protein